LRLFFPDILFPKCGRKWLSFQCIINDIFAFPRYEKVLYVDTDFIFFESPKLLWNRFESMRIEGSLVGMAPENAISW